METKPTTEVDFNTKSFKQALSISLRVPVSELKAVIMPQIGERLTAFGIQWKVTYLRTNPFRISLEPCGIEVNGNVQDMREARL